MQSNVMRFRLTDQFEVDFIGDDPRADEEAIALLQLKGCTFFRKTSFWDKDADVRRHMMTGWLSVETTNEECVSTLEQPLDIFFRPLKPQEQANASPSAP